MGLAYACFYEKEYGRYIKYSRDKTAILEVSNLWVKPYSVTIFLLLVV